MVSKGILVSRDLKIGIGLEGSMIPQVRKEVCKMAFLETRLPRLTPKCKHEGSRCDLKLARSGSPVDQLCI